MHAYIYIRTYMHIYIHIYMPQHPGTILVHAPLRLERERERERENVAAVRCEIRHYSQAGGRLVRAKKAARRRACTCRYIMHCIIHIHTYRESVLYLD